jgi:hypothetical protein
MKINSWIRSPLFDSLYILAPPFACLGMIFLFPGFFVQGAMNEWTWFLLIVCIDVGHVYSTLYRTYLDRSAINANTVLYYLSPFLLYVAGVILHGMDPMLFWRVLAYFAVFHFVRQQYGFMRLYSRGEPLSKTQKLDTLVIYTVTIYPVMYWHMHGPQSFHWFVEGDFIYFNSPLLLKVCNFLYLAVIVLYGVKEAFLTFRLRTFNLPKNILIAGTALSWYLGIVYFRGDLTFTLLNVVSHGVPYYALVWSYGNKTKTDARERVYHFFRPRYLVVFFLILFLFAYGEEYLWDGLIWKEHGGIFPHNMSLPDISANHALMSLLVPLLALPQILHYFLDGFIWKIRGKQKSQVSVPEVSLMSDLQK